MKDITPTLFLSVQELIENAKRSIVRNVNHTMVVTYFEIGRMIVEDEQAGRTNAVYGTDTINKLSNHLTLCFGKGYSADNLERMRNFYVTYRNYEGVSLNSLNGGSNSATVSRNLLPELELGWSHYVI